MASRSRGAIRTSSPCALEPRRDALARVATEDHGHASRNRVCPFFFDSRSRRLPSSSLGASCNAVSVNSSAISYFSRARSVSPVPQRLHPMLVADRGEVEQGDRCIVRAQLLLGEGEIDIAIQHHPASGDDGLAIQVARARGFACRSIGRATQFGGMAKLGGARLAERPWDDAGEAGERDDIERCERAQAHRGAAGADKVKPDLGINSPGTSFSRS